MLELTYETLPEAKDILPEQIKQEDDPIHGWIDECIQAGDAGDAVRWLIGKRAAQVAKRYGEDRIGFFAQQIHRAKSTVYEYEGMHEFYEERRRFDFLERSDALNYTHMRTAKRFALKADGKEDLAYAYLDKAAKRGYTPDEFGHKLARAFAIYGGKKRKKTIVRNAPCRIDGFDELNDIVFVKVQDEKAYAKLLRLSQEGKLDALLMTLKEG